MYPLHWQALKREMEVKDRQIEEKDRELAELRLLLQGIVCVHSIIQ